ncbi:MAG: glycosyltransferase family 2 protein [Bacteroidetes bacterium]|nr:glycosyltransferase family 2 protein [Bacteroidota bacterium]
MSGLVSIIIPCRNEERFIGKCLDSIIANDYPEDKLEVLVVDGMSEDGTRVVIEKYAQQSTNIKLLNNLGKIVPTAMNLGIKKAKGDIIIRVDAHNIYPKDYISKTVYWLEKTNADNVGGIWVTLPATDTLKAKAIALSLSSPFGVGNSMFRIGVKEPTYVDTVPFGAYRKEVFDKVGLFNEKLVRNQDIEFNLRLKKAGGNILLVPDIISYYHARSNLKDLFKQNFWNGFWIIYSTRFAKLPFSIRHLVPFAFTSSLLGSFILFFLYQPFIYLFAFIISGYMIANIFSSSSISLKNGLKYFPFLIISFFTLHFSYGIGSICGIIRLVASRITTKRFLEEL